MPLPVAWRRFLGDPRWRRRPCAGDLLGRLRSPRSARRIATARIAWRRRRLRTAHHFNAAPRWRRTAHRSRAQYLARHTDPAPAPSSSRYLASRGISFDHWPASLRFHPHCPRPKDDAGNFVEPLPAMVSLVEHVERGRWQCIARTCGRTAAARRTLKNRRRSLGRLLAVPCGSAHRARALGLRWPKGSRRRGASRWRAQCRLGLRSRLAGSKIWSCRLRRHTSLSVPITTRAVLANAPRTKLPRGGLRRAGTFALQCRLNLAPTSITFSPAAPQPTSAGRVMSREAAGAAQVRTLIGGAPEMTTPNTWPAPDVRLVNDDRAPPPALDDDALPAGWELWISTEAAARACPRDYVAAGLIGVASAWIGNARRVAATSDWIEPANLWLALIGTPSTNKTPALRPMIDASRKLEGDDERVWRKKLTKYKCDAETADAFDKTWREAVRAAVKDNKTPPDRPPNAEAPNEPRMPRAMAMNITTESLQLVLAENPRGMLYVRDELAGWFGSSTSTAAKGMIARFICSAGTATPTYQIASSSMACHCGSSTHR